MLDNSYLSGVTHDVSFPIAGVVCDGMVPIVVIVLLLIWRDPAWMKGLVAVLLPVVGYYVLCHNDIPGPLEAYNMDKPVKVLSHFHDSWRYYWVMEYLDRVAWRWGIVSVIFIILRKVFFLARRRNGGTSGEVLATVIRGRKGGFLLVCLMIW